MVLMVPFKVFAYSFCFMVWTVAQRHDFMYCAATICIYVSMYVYVCIYSIYTHTQQLHTWESFLKMYTRMNEGWRITFPQRMFAIHEINTYFLHDVRQLPF